MHKNLSDDWRFIIEDAAAHGAQDAFVSGQSLSLAREAWINAFDAAAKELDAALPVS